MTNESSEGFHSPSLTSTTESGDSDSDSSGKKSVATLDSGVDGLDWSPSPSPLPVSTEEDDGHAYGDLFTSELVATSSQLALQLRFDAELNYKIATKELELNHRTQHLMIKNDITAVVINLLPKVVRVIKTTLHYESWSPDNLPQGSMKKPKIVFRILNEFTSLDLERACRWAFFVRNPNSPRAPPTYARAPFSARSRSDIEEELTEDPEERCSSPCGSDCEAC